MPHSNLNILVFGGWGLRLVLLVSDKHQLQNREAQGVSPGSLYYWLLHRILFLCLLISSGGSSSLAFAIGMLIGLFTRIQLTKREKLEKSAFHIIRQKDFNSFLIIAAILSTRCSELHLTRKRLTSFPIFSTRWNKFPLTKNRLR